MEEGAGILDTGHRLRQKAAAVPSRSPALTCGYAVYLYPSCSYADACYGDIYITETSQHFQRRRIFYAAMDGKPTGRLLRYQPTHGVVEVVANNLFIPNGVALSHDKKSLLIVCGVRILRFDLDTQQMDPTPFVDVMPGTGDNIKTMNMSLYGKKVKCYYAALGGTYKEPFSLLKFVSDKPWFRSVLLALVPYRKNN